MNEKYRTGKELKYLNKPYGFPVVTNQEKELIINSVVGIKETNDNNFEMAYSEKPQPEFCKDWKDVLQKDAMTSCSKQPKFKKHSQLKLLDE